MTAHAAGRVVLPGQPTDEGARLVALAAGAQLADGTFGWLDDAGRPDPARPRHLWISTRMTYVLTLAAQLGVEGARERAERGIAALRGPFRDPEHGGWYAALTPDGTGPLDDAKAAYPHAFVALAAGSAALAGIAGAEDLLAEVVEVLRGRFLDADGRVVESYDRTFATVEDYRGANASMHLVEAAAVLADATGDPAWDDFALGIAEHLVHGVARAYDFRLPEHFSATWQPLPRYHADRPDDPFRPYGATPGHLFEWSRLLTQLAARHPAGPGWLLTDAQALFAEAVRVGWDVDGEPGFVYTVDFAGHPVVHTRMHWVAAEAVLAADALHRATDRDDLAAWAGLWSEHVDAHFVDHERGGWRHELDRHNRPAATVWQGRPDV